MNTKHLISISILFRELLAKPSPEGNDIYESLVVLTDDLRDYFEENTINSGYMNEKLGLFIDSCRAIAGLQPHAVSFEATISCAEGQLQNLGVLPQWKVTDTISRF